MVNELHNVAILITKLMFEYFDFDKRSRIYFSREFSHKLLTMLLMALKFKKHFALFMIKASRPWVETTVVAIFVLCIKIMEDSSLVTITVRW